MNVAISQDSNQLDVVISGELDADNCAELGHSLLPHLERDDVTLLSLDLSGLGFIDSSGISELLRVRDRIVSTDRTFEVAAASSQVLRVLEMTGLKDILGLPD